MSKLSGKVVLAIEKAFQKHPGDTVKIARELEKSLGVSREVADQMVLKQPQMLKDQQVRVMVDEMEVNPGLARQVADGDITLGNAQTRSANQNRKLETGKEQGVMDDNVVISSVRGADPDGIKLRSIKDDLSPAQKAELTDAEIAYKRGNPKPLAKLYRTLGIAGAVGAGGALASEDAEAMPSLILRKGLDYAMAGRQIKNKINKEGGGDGKAVERFIHEQTNYDGGFTQGARKWDKGRNGDTYVQGVKQMAYDLLQNTDDPQVKKAVMGWLAPRLQRAAVPVAGVGMSNAALASPEVKDSGMASAPRSETLGSITMGLRDLERRVEGSPAEVIFPTGLTEYLETVNRRTEDPNARTRMFAALDVAPL